MVWPKKVSLIRGYFSRDFKKESEVMKLHRYLGEE